MAKTEYTVLKRILFTCFTLTFLLCACQRERHASDVADDRVFVKADTVWYPDGTASNVITYLAKGDLALSVGMTAVSTLHFATYPLATIPGALFSVWHNISGAIVAKLYSRNA